MIRGIYTAASGMIAQRRELDAIANNLANIDLVGYKKEVASQKSFPELLIRRLNEDGVFNFEKGYLETAPVVGKLGTGVEENELFTSFEQGAIKITNNKLDLALTEKGFFAVETARGERYTRNGSFTLGREGILMTKDGFPLLGENGYIYLKENNFKINERGQIFYNPNLQDDPQRLISMQENNWEAYELLDTIKIVNFENERYLRKEGNSLWSSNELSGKALNLSLNERPKLETGALESSNVSAVIEMVKMIEVNRAYEANQKSIATHDYLLGKLLNETAKY